MPYEKWKYPVDPTATDTTQRRVVQAVAGGGAAAIRSGVELVAAGEVAQCRPRGPRELNAGGGRPRENAVGAAASAEPAEGLAEFSLDVGVQVGG